MNASRPFRRSRVPAAPHGAGAFLILLAVLSCGTAGAAEWRVTPIRLDLGRDAKSGAVTIVNESDERLQLQMAAFEWTQDKDGKDRYEETDDILFFPKIMIFDRKGEKILRAGVKGPAPAKEKTYRLFVEEIPEPKQAEGARVAIAIRFGLPVFVKPLKEEARGEVAGLSMAGGVLNAVVKNTGNVHFLIQGIRIRGKNPKGEEIFSKELAGWYLLAGASRPYASDVPADICRGVAGFDVEVRTETSSFTGKLVADPSMCATK
jgi:fimbrial chaperone protein